MTATELNMGPFGKIVLHVDGQPVDLRDHLIYKSLMVSEVPNFAFTVGYVNHAWTLKADLVAGRVMLCCATDVTHHSSV